MNQIDVLMIGCGNMGRSLLKNWLKSGDRYAVVDPVLANPIAGAELLRDTSALTGRKFDLLIIAIKPQLIDKVMPTYAPFLADAGYVLSIAAGCSIDRIKAATNDAPVVRVMPNLPAAIGKGVSALCASADATEAHFDHARRIMEHTGTALAVESENQIDRFTAIAGSGPGYVFELSRAYVEAAMQLGFDKDAARTMVLDMIDGTVAMARSSDEDLADLRNSVTSKGGTTAAGLNALNGDGQLSALFDATLGAAYTRALELK